MRRALVLAAFLPCATLVQAQGVPAYPAAQASAAPSVGGQVTGIAGIELPPGFVQHRGMLYRLAAKAELAITAKNARQKLGNGYEVYRMLAKDGTTSMAAIAAALQQQGWTVTPIGSSTTDAWLDRAGTRVMLIARANAQEAWAYLAPAQEAAPPVMVAGGADPNAGAVAPAYPAAPAPTYRAAPAPAYPAAPAPAPASASVAPTAAYPLPLPTPAPLPAASVPTMPAAPPPARAYRHERSNFNDGWTAYEGTAGVKVEKGPLTAWLFTARALTTSMNDGTPGDQLWKSDVVSWFTPRTIGRRIRGADGTPIEYIEAEGTVNATGQPAFVAMYAAQPDNAGIYNNIVLVGPDKATTQAEYGTTEAMFTLLQYNKFAVDAADLAGQWLERGQWKMQLAYVNPALVQGEPVTTDITFTADGRYTSRDRAPGAGGASVEQLSSGSWALTSPWTLVITDAQGRASTFGAQFELVQGGRVLHLVMQGDPSVKYHLTLVR